MVASPDKVPESAGHVLREWQLARGWADEWMYVYAAYGRRDIAVQ